MIEVTVPGYKKLQFKHLVMDFNGTMACDGILIDGLTEILDQLDSKLNVHILTADTFGNVKQEVSKLKASVAIIPDKNQDKAKLDYINSLGADYTVCIGNGKNDSLMLKNSALGIALIQEEGANIQALLAADIVCKDIISALNLLINTKRMIATLRS